MAAIGDIFSNNRQIYFYPYAGLQYTASWDLRESPNVGSQTQFRVRCFFQDHSDSDNVIEQLKQWSCSGRVSGYNDTSTLIRPTLTLLNNIGSDGNRYESFDFAIDGLIGTSIVDFSYVPGLLRSFKASSNPSTFQFNIYAFVVDLDFYDPIFFKININGNLGYQTNDVYNLSAYADTYDKVNNHPIPYPDLYGNGGKLNAYGQVISFKCYAVNGFTSPGLNGAFLFGAVFYDVSYNGYSNNVLYNYSTPGYGLTITDNQGTTVLTQGKNINPNFSPVNPIVPGTSYMYWNSPFPTPIDKLFNDAVWGEEFTYSYSTYNNNGSVSTTNTASVVYPTVPPPAQIFARNIVFFPIVTSVTIPTSDLVGTVINVNVVPDSVIGDLQFKLTWGAPEDYSAYASLANVVYFTVNIYDGIYVDLVDSIIFNDNTGAINGGTTKLAPLTVSSHKMQANSPYYVSINISYQLSNGTVISNPSVAPVAPGMRSLKQAVLANGPTLNQTSLTTGNVVTSPIITELTTKSNNITVKWDYNYIPNDRQGIQNIYIYVIQYLLNNGNGLQIPAPNTNSGGYLVPLNADGSDPKVLTITDLPPGTYYAFIATYYNSTQNIKDYYTYLNPFTIPITATSVSTPQVLGNAVSQVNPSTPNQNGIKLYVTPSVYNDGSTGPGLPASYYNLSAANTSYYFQQYTQPGKYVTLLPELSVSTTLSTDTDGSSYYFWPSSNNPVDNVTLQNGQTYEFYATAVYVDADGNTYTSSISEPSEPFAPVSKTPDVPLGFTGAVNGNTVTLYLSKNPTGVYGDVTAGYLFNFNNPSLPIFDSANLISGNGPNNTTSYYITQPLDVGSYSVSATAYDLNNIKSASSPTISLEVVPQSPPNITSVKVFPGQNSYSVYWTVDPVLDFNTQIPPTYFLVSYRIHGETGEGTELAYSNMYSMTTQVGGTLDPVSQFPNGNTAIVSNYPYSANFHLDTTGNTLYDFKVTPYSVITIPGKESPTTSSNLGLWDTNDGDGYSMVNAQLGSLSPLFTSVVYDSQNRTITVRTTWQSLVGANIYNILHVYTGNSIQYSAVTSNSYPTPDSDNVTSYYTSYTYANVTNVEETGLIRVIVFASNDTNGYFSSSSTTSEFVTVIQ